MHIISLQPNEQELMNSLPYHLMLLELGCLLLKFGSMLCHHNFDFVNKFKCWYCVLDGVQDYIIVYVVFWDAIFADLPHSRKENL